MKCPDCNNEVRDYKKICSFCGHIFEDNLFPDSYNDTIDKYIDKYSKIPVKSYKTRNIGSKIIFKNISNNSAYQWFSNNMSPEEFTINFYKKKGYNAFFAENNYWILLFLIIYDYKSFVLNYTIYELVSMGIQPDQYLLNKIDAIDVNSLKNIPNITNHIIDTFFRNISHSIPPKEFDNYDEYSSGLKYRFTVDEFIVANSYLTEEQLILIFERMCDDFKYYAYGFPDLIVYNEDEFFFVEVKSKIDKPSFKQIQWHKFLVEVVGIDVVLFMIDKDDEQVNDIKQMYDVELLDSKKRKNSNIKISEQRVFIDWNDEKIKQLIFHVSNDEFNNLIHLRHAYSKKYRKYVVNEYTRLSPNDFGDFNEWREYRRMMRINANDFLYKKVRELYYSPSFEDYRPTQRQLERNKKAKLFENNGEYSKAINLYMENVVEKTGSPVTYKRLIYILNKFNRFDDIIKLMDIAIPLFVTLDDRNNSLKFVYQKFEAMNGNKSIPVIEASNNVSKSNHKKNKDKQADLSSYFN